MLRNTEKENEKALRCAYQSVFQPFMSIELVAWLTINQKHCAVTKLAMRIVVIN